MPSVKVYHNPHFLDYQDNHNRVVSPTVPIATVQVPDGLTSEEALSWAYARTQHIDTAWWNNEDVVLHARSTSVGDLLGDERGNHFVVERFGFQPWRPIVVSKAHRLAEAYRILDAAVDQDCECIGVRAVCQARDLIQYVLEFKGCVSGEISIMPWAQARPGDIVCGDQGRFQVIARKLRPKSRAERIQERIPDAQIWVDSPPTHRLAHGRLWAVLLPVPADQSM